MFFYSEEQPPLKAPFFIQRTIKINWIVIDTLNIHQSINQCNTHKWVNLPPKSEKKPTYSQISQAYKGLLSNISISQESHFFKKPDNYVEIEKYKKGCTITNTI